VDDEAQHNEHPPALLGRHPEKFLLAHWNPPSLKTWIARDKRMNGNRRSASLCQKTQNRARVIEKAGNCQMEKRALK
ncbi:MAG TPA: hypothetical protein PK793_10705, partial [Syntrophales bacterium]|nr:hypothetical protein [Syntrophales bacterium]HPV54517.1 hypothetical protein [Syntrophales bacterium]